MSRTRRLNPPSNTAQAKKPVSIRGRNENHNHDLKNLFNTRHYCWIVHSEVGPLPGMLYCEARRAARRDARGRYVPLSEQNPNQWSLPLIEEAEHHLAEAFKHGSVGRFQLEAAIQSACRARAHRPDRLGGHRAVLRTTAQDIADARHTSRIRRRACGSKRTGSGTRRSRID